MTITSPAELSSVKAKEQPLPSADGRGNSVLQGTYSLTGLFFPASAHIQESDYCKHSDEYNSSGFYIYIHACGYL